MARKQIRHPDGNVESWDDSTGEYVHSGPAGEEVEKRPLTDAECSMLDPANARIAQLQDAVDQLILDALMGGF